jgi:hypothetical protein
LRLRTRGAQNSLSLYAFMAWTEKTVHVVNRLLMVLVINLCGEFTVGVLMGYVICYDFCNKPETVRRYVVDIWLRISGAIHLLSLYASMAST